MKKPFDSYESDQQHVTAGNIYIGTSDSDTANEHATAQFNLGVLYRDGRGIEQSFERAIEYFKTAAANEHANAQYSVGAMYYNGQGVEQSYALAREWWTKSSSTRKRASH